MARGSVFVACPYTLFPLDDYKKTFQAVSRSQDVHFRFADEQITNQHILEKVRNYISTHDFSLFDITGWNPNVALELGIAVGLGKKYFVLFNHKIDPNKDAPSDIRGVDRIQYGSNSELEAKLILLMKQEFPAVSRGSDSAFDRLKVSIIEALSAEPGLGLTKLAGAVKEDKLLVQSVVRAMAQAGELKTRGQKKGTVYFTPSTDLRTAPRRR
jgi:hypothetical protein